MSIEAMVAVAHDAPPDGARNVSSRDVLRVLTALAEYADPSGQGARPSQTTIAEVIGLDRRTVRNALDALELQDRIRVTGKAVPRHHGTVYALRLGLRWGDDSGVDSGGDSTPESEPPAASIRAGDSGGGLGRGTQAGIPRHDPDPDPEPCHTPYADSLDSSDPTTSDDEQPQRANRRVVLWSDQIVEGAEHFGIGRPPRDVVVGNARYLEHVEATEGGRQAPQLLVDALARCQQDGQSFSAAMSTECRDAEYSRIITDPTTKPVPTAWRWARRADGKWVLFVPAPPGRIVERLAADDVYGDLAAEEPF